MIDDYVKHFFREHNQEVDHLPHLGAERQRKITVDKGDNTENWKGCTRIFGRQQKVRPTERIWCCDRRCAQGQMDHNQ